MGGGIQIPRTLTLDTPLHNIIVLRSRVLNLLFCSTFFLELIVYDKTARVNSRS